MIRSLIVVLLALVPVSAFAQSSGIEFTPFFGIRGGGTIARGTNDIFGQDVQVDESLVVGATLGIPLTRNLELEILGEHQPSELVVDEDLFGGGGSIADIGVSYVHAGLNYEFDAARNVRPFLGGSLGVALLDIDLPGTSNEARLSGSLGGGVKYYVNRNFGLRFEGRGFWTDIDDRDWNDCTLCVWEEDQDFYQAEARMGFIVSF